MTQPFLDRCIFQAAANGTADFVIIGALIGYQAPSSAGAVDGQELHYAAQSLDLLQWEVGKGIYSTVGPSLTRATILHNVLGTGTAQGGPGTKINFTLPPAVLISALAEDIGSGGGGGTIVIGDTPPVGAAVGTLWFESDSGLLFILYDDGNTTQWVSASGAIGPPGPPGLPDTIIVADTPPVGAADAKLWFESDSGLLFILYNDGSSIQWVSIGGSQGVPEAPMDGQTYGRKNGAWVVIP